MRILVTVLSACIILLSASCSPRFMPTGTLGKYVYFPVDPRQLITVDDPSIRQTLNTITSDTTDFRSDFRKLQAWVSSHIVYSNDSYYHWQTPAETLQKRTGNCKDFAVLLCTLSRAAGVPADDIFVAIGKDRSNNTHAFIIEKWVLDRWQVVEPQVGGFVISDLTAIDTADTYSIYSRFNDKYYLGETAYITGSEKYLRTASPASTASSQASAGSEPEAVSPSPTVNPLPEIDYFYFKQVPNVVGASSATMLTWQVTGATLVYIDNGIGYVASSGSQLVSAPATAFTITARNENGEVKTRAFR